MKKILEYLNARYAPLALIVYGSFADGTETRHSDFDALLIYEGEQSHEHSIVDGVELDVFLYPLSHFQQDYNPDDFLQIWDGIILKDVDDTAKNLQKRVLKHLQKHSLQSLAEKQQSLLWCKKMLKRAQRGDSEGDFRRYMLLIESLEIYCNLQNLIYYGPKKALKLMQSEDTKAKALYTRALQEPSIEHMEEWVKFLESLV